VWGFLGWNDRAMMPEHVHLFDADNGARLIG
jgi:hypothetical protein